jgi:beta-lactam-binding protein with PASTA domain
VVRLTDNPVGDGIVVAQDPVAGARVRRHSTLTIQVVHRSADDSGASRRS